jgi:hypothetical protein
LCCGLGVHKSVLVYDAAALSHQQRVVTLCFTVAKPGK